MPETLALTWEICGNYKVAGVRFYRSKESQNLLYSLEEKFTGNRVELNDFFFRYQPQIGEWVDMNEDPRTENRLHAVRYAVETPWVPEKVARLKRELSHAEAVRDGHKSEWDEACKRVDTLKGQIRDEEARR